MDNMNDSQKIEELLHHFRMEQKEFAEKCGILPDTISNIKRGKQGISKRVMLRVLKSFPSVNKQWLLDGEEPMLKNSVNKSIIENSNGNFQQGQHINDIKTFEVTITELQKGFQKIIETKDEQIKEKDEQIKQLIEIIKNKLIS